MSPKNSFFNNAVIVDLYSLLMQWEDDRHTVFLEPERVEDTLVKKFQGSVDTCNTT